MLSQTSMTTSPYSHCAYLIWISIVQLLMMTIISHNWCGIHHDESTASFFFISTLLIDHSMTNRIRCSILTPKICSWSIGSDKSYRGNKIIAGMNEEKVSNWKSCGNEIVINFIPFNDYGMKYINIYGVSPE